MQSECSRLNLFAATGSLAGTVMGVNEGPLANGEPHGSEDPHNPDAVPLAQFFALIVVPTVGGQHVTTRLRSWGVGEREARLVFVLVEPLQHIRQSTRVEVVQPTEPPPNCEKVINNSDMHPRQKADLKHSEAVRTVIPHDKKPTKEFGHCTPETAA